MENKTTPLTNAALFDAQRACGDKYTGEILVDCEVVEADFARRLESALAVAEEALRGGVYDGRLQTFEDRERWRDIARAALAQIEELRK